MRERCFDSSNPAYPNYGGRGITVCDRWLTFAHFVADMGKKPDGYTLERKDNNGNYCPDNCVWASRTDQNRNRRFFLTIKDDDMRCITVRPTGFYLQMKLLGRRINKMFPTLQEARDYRDETEYERTFQRMLGLRSY